MVRTRARILCTFVVAASLSGCTLPPRGARYAGDPDPSIKIPAIRQVAAQRDTAQVPVVVKDLSSDDPAVRFYAIRALQKMTDGDAKGYVYYAPDDERAAAVERWQAWLADEQQQNGGAR
ncbi:MAG TPA: HEAT repeat domain-containing protein [Tepidisphaeraceae bacterium]|nr:HEAT repeat domain-containing protein [Tepidisphaeraceae bacterium]